MLNTTNTFTFPLGNHHTSSIFAPMVCSCCHKSESYIPFEHIWLWPCVELYYPLLIEYKCIPEHRFPSIRLCLNAWYSFLEHLNIKQVMCSQSNQTKFLNKIWKNGFSRISRFLTVLESSQTRDHVECTTKFKKRSSKVDFIFEKTAAGCILLLLAHCFFHRPIKDNL